MEGKIELQTCSAEESDELLRKVYGVMRNKNQECYQRSWYLAARAAIQQYLNTLQRTLEGFSQTEFLGRKTRPQSWIERNKHARVEWTVQHKDSITDADKAYLAKYFE